MKNMKKALIEFESRTYWVDLISDKKEVSVMEDNKLRPVLTTEIDLFALLETGKVIGDKKPE